MKKELLALVFKTTNYARDLNIGETVLLTHRNGRYILSDGVNTYGEQITTFDESADNLLSYVADKRNIQLYIWDDEYNTYLSDSMVEVAAIDNEHIVIIPNDDVQEMLMVEPAEDELSLDEFSIDDLLADLLCDNNCERCEDASNMTCEEVKEEKKEETRMFSDLGSSFGKINSDQFKLSINGLAVRGKEGKYYTFNPETRELVEVTTGFFDDMKDLLFVMPATELEVGDIILHQNKPYYISVAKNDVIKGIDFEDAIESTLVPKTNVFGIKYYTKVFNCLGTNNILGTDIASNPMMAYALMGGKDFDLSKVMLFQALGQGNGIADFSENPIMLMALMGNENGGGDLSNFAKMQVLSQLSGNKKKETKKATKETN